MREVIPKKEIEKLFQENKGKFDAKKYEKGREIIPKEDIDRLYDEFKEKELEKKLKAKND